MNSEDISNTIQAHLSKGTTVFDKQFDQGVIEAKRLYNIYGYEGGNFAGNVYEKDGAAPAILTAEGGNRQPMIEELHTAKCVGGIGEKKSNGGTQYYQQDRISEGDVALALPAELSGLSYNYKMQKRIRKLTERECFRLMGVKDDDFAKIRANQSMSSCYHLAGDSIITSCLMAIFGQMLGIDYEAKIKELTEEVRTN